MKRRFPFGRTFLIGFGFLGISIIWPIFDQFIPIFLQAGNPEFANSGATANIIGFGLSSGLTMFIMTWDNIINLFVSPWVGERSDHTWNRFGRRKPWILLGLPLAMLGFVFVPIAQSVLAIAVFILITNFGMALFRSPTVAWLGDLFDKDERSQANGIINFMGGLGSLLAYLGGGYIFNTFSKISPEAGRMAPFIAGTIATIIALVTALVFVKEPAQVETSGEGKPAGVLKNLSTVATNPDKSGLFVLFGILFWFMAYNALGTALSSFAVFSLGIAPGTASMMAAGVSISVMIFAIPAGLLGRRFGRRRIILYGLVGLLALVAAGFFLVQETVAFVIFLILAGGFWALVNVNSLPLVYDYGDERKIGAYTGLYYFSSQAAAILGPTLNGQLVQALGSEYRWTMLFSTVFFALAILVMYQVKEAKTKLGAAAAATD